MNQQFWDDKRYHSLNYYLKHRFGEKVYKVALDGGMTCPNRDGTLDSRGCIFCSAGGSGDFAAPACQNVTGQIDHAIAGIRRAKVKNNTVISTNKTIDCNKFIAYFQSYTNTYAPLDYLKP
ncbi:MAG: TIGR01212 family radical SAM protein, partial [Lachnospiraceae bacterium]|nr:TIGR01212 family radical SAM protein [Lachnospiraceae bacterium]